MVSDPATVPALDALERRSGTRSWYKGSIGAESRSPRVEFGFGVVQKVADSVGGVHAGWMTEISGADRAGQGNRANRAARLGSAA